ncbi:hypothetical protein LTS10_002862 [Elasticomyces elasticus]|nr:hypothetical protein LTS10_002862 [Elasticomyces elasticus]
MARTKQTARRSTSGGIAPVRQRMPKAAATSVVIASVKHSTLEKADEDDEEEVKRETSSGEANGDDDEAECTPAGPLERVASNQATRRSHPVTETPTSRKRVRSPSEHEADSDSRCVKRVPSSTVPDTLPSLADPREEIMVLRTHTKELHRVVQDTGILLKVPSSVRKHLDALENGAAVFSDAIRRAMLDAVRGQLDGDIVSGVCCHSSKTSGL